MPHAKSVIRDLDLRLQVLQDLDIPNASRAYLTQLGNGDVLAGARRAIEKAHQLGMHVGAPTGARRPAAPEDVRLRVARALHLTNASRQYLARLGAGDVVAGARIAIETARVYDAAVVGGNC